MLKFYFIHTFFCMLTCDLPNKCEAQGQQYIFVISSRLPKQTYRIDLRLCSTYEQERSLDADICL